MNDSQFEKLLEQAGRKSGTDKNAIREAISSGDMSRVLQNLNPKEVEKIQSIMNNKSQLEKILNSKQAQELMKRLGDQK